MPFRKINVSEFIGKRYGRLVIVGRSHRNGQKGKGYIWDCVCDCGRTTQVMADHLYGPSKGKTRSCGCLHLENSRRFRSPGESGLLKVFRNYQNGAKNRGINFDLTFEEFKILTTKNCVYCGEPPNRRSVVNNCRSNFSVCYYNGIDRIDSLKGYQLDNVSTCCYSCNCMKLNRSRTDFLKQVARIYRRNEEEIAQMKDLTNCDPPYKHDKALPLLEVAVRKTENKTDSVFYALMDIAKVKYGDKDYILTTSGAYRFIYIDGMGKKHHGNDSSLVIERWTDKDIENLRLTGAVRNWGQFTIVTWTRTNEEDSSMELYPAGPDYDGAFQTFIDFVKTKTGITTTLQEKNVTFRNMVQRLLRRRHSAS